MSDPHVHKFNATHITTRSNPVLRCACGAWTSLNLINEAKKLGAEPRLITPRTAKGLETRLHRTAHRPDTDGRWPETWQGERQGWVNPDADNTAATDDVLRGRRKPT